MKYYGIEICRFCGVDVSTDVPSISPDFIVKISQKNKGLLVAVDTVNVVDFSCVINKTSKNKLKAVYRVSDTEEFTVVIDRKPSNKLIAIMADYEVN